MIRHSKRPFLAIINQNVAVRRRFEGILDVLELAVGGCQMILESARLAWVGSWTVLLLIKTFCCTERVGSPDPPTSVQLKESARLWFCQNFISLFFWESRLVWHESARLHCVQKLAFCYRESRLFLRWVGLPVLTSELNYFVPRTRACQSQLFHRSRLLQKCTKKSCNFMHGYTRLPKGLKRLFYIIPIIETCNTRYISLRFKKSIIIPLKYLKNPKILQVFLGFKLKGSLTSWAQ